MYTEPTFDNTSPKTGTVCYLGLKTAYVVGKKTEIDIETLIYQLDLRCPF